MKEFLSFIKIHNTLSITTNNTYIVPILHRACLPCGSRRTILTISFIIEMVFDHADDREVTSY